MQAYYEIIFYVSDQEKSKNFYSYILQQEPILDVEGMTEFTLQENLKLGLMPEKGIAKIITPPMPHPSKGNGIPRNELYIFSEDYKNMYQKAINAGACKISAIKQRDWGHAVGYVSDLDGHVIAFAWYK